MAWAMLIKSEQPPPPLPPPCHTHTHTDTHTTRTHATIPWEPVRALRTGRRRGGTGSGAQQTWA